MLNFYFFLINPSMATRRNVPDKGIDGGRILVPYANGARFFAPLTDSVVPNRSMWPITFSRTTTATVEDHEGVVRYAKSGETRFKWARRVENIATYSQAIDNAAWIKWASSISGTKVAYTDWSIIGQTIIEDSANSQHTISQSINYVAWDNYILSFSAKSAGRTFIQMLVSSSVTSSYQNFDLTNGTCAGTASAGTITAEGNGWYRCSMSFTSIGTTAALTYALLANSLADTRFQAYLGAWVSGVSVTRIQVQNVTGQSIQTPAEYVSTNVLSSPFHGAMVDGVKYFDTTLSGAKLYPDGYLAEGQKTNLFPDSEAFNLWTLWGTGSITPNATIAPDGRMTADLFTLSTSNEWQSVSKTLTTSATIYGYSVYVKPNGHNYVQLLAASGISSGYINFDLTNGTVGTSSSYTGRVEALANWWYRLKATTPSVTAATGAFLIAPVPNASASRGNFVSGTGSSWVYLWWAQLEVGASSSYIPSTLGTRNDDLLEYQLRNLQSTKWTVYVEARTYFTTTNTAVLGLTGSSCRILGSLWASPWFYLGSGTQVVSNDGSTNTTSSNSVSSSQYNRVLWKYSGVLNEICLNGTLSSGTFDGTTSYTNLYIGNASLWRWLYGSIRNLQIWDYEVTDSEAIALTTI